MKQVNDKENLWVEKYRPQCIDDCILPYGVKTEFQSMLDSGLIGNRIFHGGAGMGKTTAAKALCDELGATWLFIRASEDSGIDIVRNDIRKFASSASLSGGQKVVILDEADYLNRQSTQPALRSFIEEFSNVGFILTCNYPQRLMDAIHSRCPSVSFDFKAEKQELQKQLFTRCLYILDQEGVEYEPAVVAAVIKKCFPDFRRTIGSLQQYGNYGPIDEGILSQLEGANIDDLIAVMKAKDFKGVLQWTANNADVDFSQFYWDLCRALKPLVPGQSYAQTIMTTADYQKFNDTVPNMELHINAMLIELMGSIAFD